MSPFAKHEIEYIKKFSLFANHKTTICVNPDREDLPLRIRYHFKKDMVVAYFGSAWSGQEAKEWAIPPIVDINAPDHIELFWRYE